MNAVTARKNPTVIYSRQLHVDQYIRINFKELTHDALRPAESL